MGTRINSKNGTDEWYTDAGELSVILQAAGIPKFGGDPCSPISGPTVPAAWYLTKAENGLSHPWNATDPVWMNPPYSQKKAWLKKAEEEVEAGRCPAVLGLLPASTEQTFYHETVMRWPHFISLGRLRFFGPVCPGGGKTSTGSVLIVFSRDEDFVERFRRGLQGSRWAFCGYPPDFGRVPEPPGLDPRKLLAELGRRLPDSGNRAAMMEMIESVLACRAG